jgi:hypothetical protein
MQGELFLDTDADNHKPWFRKLGEACARLFRKPTREEIEERSRRDFIKTWDKWGKDGFIVIRSAEGAPSTPEQARGFRPADGSPVESVEQE